MQVIAPCGAGKTIFIGMLIKEFHTQTIEPSKEGNGEGSGAATTSATAITKKCIALIAAPLIEIAAKNATKIMNYLREQKLFVKGSSCASHIGKENAIAFGQRGMNPKDTVEWMKKMTKVKSCYVIVVGVTFASLYDLLKCLSESGLVGNKLLFIDEAHRTTGLRCSVDPETGKPLTGPGSRILPSKSFPEFYDLFEMIISLTATPKVHRKNGSSIRGGCETFYGNGLVYCGAASVDLREIDARTEGDKVETSLGTKIVASAAEENSSREEEEDVDDSDDETASESPSEEEGNDGQDESIAKKKKKRSIPYHPLSFNCQNDAFGSYGPILISLNRKQAEEAKIIVKERIRLIGGGDEVDNYNEGLCQVVSSWNEVQGEQIISEDINSKDKEFQKNATGMEILRICLLWIVLLDVAAGEHTHVACYFQRIESAKAGALMIRNLAILMKTMLDTKRTETCQTYGLDINQADAAILRLEKLAENCYCLVSSDRNDENMKGRETLIQFRTNPVAIITSVNMLKIGVDIRCMSAAVHCDPISNVTDIEQANGRVRRSANLNILQADGSFLSKKKEYCTIYVPMQLNSRATLEKIQNIHKQKMEMLLEQRPELGHTEDTAILYTRSAEVECSMNVLREVIRQSRESGHKSTIVGILRASLSGSGGGSNGSSQNSVHKTHVLKLQISDLSVPHEQSAALLANIEIEADHKILKLALEEHATKKNERFDEEEPMGHETAIAALLAVARQTSKGSDGLSKRRKTRN